MDLDGAFATGFLGAFVLTFLARQFFRLWRQLKRPVRRFLTQHVTLPRIRQGRHFFNPSRAQVLAVAVHWVVIGFYNIYQVHTLTDAAKRAGRSALLHIVLLLAPNHIYLSSSLFGTSLPTATFSHFALGCMAIVQGTLHCILQALDKKGPVSLDAYKITAIVALGLLAISPLGRSHMFERFLLTHRAAAITLIAMLWVHIKPSQRLSWALLIAGTSLYGITSALQFARQVYISMDNRLHIGRVQQVTEDKDSYMLEIRTARAWRIRPGTYLLLTVLNWRYASFLQRHPFVVAWYDNWDDESRIYFIVQKRKGWTNYINNSQLLDRKAWPVDRMVWLDGPHGKPYDTEESGIFAHLLILKSLVESLRFGSTKTQRVVLMWNTTGYYHKSIPPWLTQLIVETDEHTSFLDLNIHISSDADTGARRKSQLAQRVKLHYHHRSVEEYIDYVVGHRHSRRIAIVVSAGIHMREDTRSAVLGKKLSGVKTSNHSPTTAKMWQDTQARDVESLGRSTLHEHVAQHGERHYELELLEHDYQPPSR